MCSSSYDKQLIEKTAIFVFTDGKNIQAANFDISYTESIVLVPHWPEVTFT